MEGNDYWCLTAYQPTQEEQMSALLYMYSNMDEMDQYFM
jgi:hypothetical protein